MSEYDDLLLDAYRGEVLGAALFGAMAGLTTLRTALPPFLANFERLRAIGGDDEPVLEDLVAHERAIDRFAELELEGRHADALDVLETHLAAA
jgi:hypothetical protein